MKSMSTKPEVTRGGAASGHQAKIGKTLKDSTPWWREPVLPAEGSPNVVVILLDDLGFSDFGCFGSEIRTPHIDALAAGGLRYTQYTTVPMCTPARASMFTGKNPHAVGCGWLTHADPGYPGYQAGEISADAPTIAEILRHMGYRTYGVGKWHNVDDHKATSASDRSAWPLQRGFDRYYGFLGAETNFFAPGHLIEGNEFLPIDEYPSGYYSSDDWTSRAIRYLRGHRSAAPDRPFFLYLAHNAPHVPLQARSEDIAAYQGMYDAGWDAIRIARCARQKAMGLLPEHWRLPAGSPGVPSWEDIPAEKRPLMAHYMQIYAAMVENIDANVGRLVAELKALGQWDNTLLLLTSDNGASSIGGPDGAANIFEKRVTQKEDPNLPMELLQAGQLGGADSYPAYPVAWAQASNTPFRFYKRTPMNGGIRVPMVLSWPDRVKDGGALREQWVHVSDVLPTLLDVLGQSYPAQFNGFATRGLDGVSFAATLSEPKAKSLRTQQYYELEGNRGYIAVQGDDVWKIASLQPPGQPIDVDRWTLFNLRLDPTECDNLAASHSGKLLELIQLFEADAKTNHVYPLDNRDPRRVLALSPYWVQAYSQAREYYPGTETIAPAAISALISDRDFKLNCCFECPTQPEGVIFAIGDHMNGLAAYVMDGQLSVSFRAGRKVLRHLSTSIGEGSFELELDHVAKGQRQGLGKLRLNGKPMGELDMSPCFLRVSGEGIDVGLDRKRKSSPAYADRGAFTFNGSIRSVRIEPGAQAPDSLTNRPEALAQLD
ncbi:MAG: arylsulfatase [Brachymonas sp.]